MTKHDYHWIKLDKTKDWKKEFLDSIGPDARIISTYVFDHNSAVHFCDIRPSYVLERAGTEFKTSREMSDAERDDIEEKIRAEEAVETGDEAHYCSAIDDNKRSKPISGFVDCDDDVTIEDVIEYYQGNSW